MSSFNDANVNNRLRFLVRGRVIVFTTSLVVEFLEESLKHSFPLYSVDGIPDGFGLAFSVELSGYLTFDQNSYVKISNELTPFSRVHYDPNGASIVRAADAPIVLPPPPVVVTLSSFTRLGSWPGGPDWEVYSILFSDGTGTQCIIRPDNLSKAYVGMPHDDATAIFSAYYGAYNP